MISKNKLIRLKGKINGIDALMLIDSGSSGDFISTSFVQKNNIRTINSNNNNYSSNGKNESRRIELANGSTHISDAIVYSLDVSIGGSYNDKMDFTVFPLKKYDAILGMTWLEKNNTKIDYKNKSVKLKSSNNNKNNGGLYISPSRRNITLATVNQIKRQAAKNKNLFLIYLYCLEDGSIDRIEQHECNSISVNNNDNNNNNKAIDDDIELLLSKI